MNLVIALLLFLFLLFIGLFKTRIKGKIGEKTIATVLSFLNKSQYKVINNIVLKTGGRTSQIDHLVISDFGIFVIETKNYKGWILGNEHSDYWTQVIYKRRERRMIGFEDTPEKSAEICIMEIKGWNIKKDKAKIGMGIHKFNDPELEEDFSEDEHRIDVTQFHIYATEWSKEKIIFLIDNVKVKEINQSPNYPMQLMLGIYEIPDVINTKTEKKYPKEFIIDYVKGYN